MLSTLVFCLRSSKSSGSFYFPAPICPSVIEELLLVITVLSINILRDCHMYSVSHHHKKPPKKFQTYISIFDRLHHCFVLGSVLMGQGPKIGQQMTILKNGLVNVQVVTHPKSRKRLKSKLIPSFLGDVGLIKVVSEFSSGHRKCHFWALKDGYFCQKCPQKNGTSDAGTKILRPLL